MILYLTVGIVKLSYHQYFILLFFTNAHVIDCKNFMTQTHVNNLFVCMRVTRRKYLSTYCKYLNLPI